MVRLGELRVRGELLDELVVGARLPQPQPREERDDDQERRNRDVVRRGDNRPELTPVLDDDLGPEERQALEASLERSAAQLARDELMDADEVLRRLRRG